MCSDDRTYDVTVLIPAYNEEADILTAIESIYHNDGITIQTLVVDDASTDDTYWKVYNSEYDVKVFRNKENKGKGASLNTLFPFVKGRYWIVLDADDTFEPQALAILAHTFDFLVEDSNRDNWFVYGRTYYHGMIERIHVPPIFKADQFYKHNPVCSPIMCPRRTFEKDNIKYIEDLRIAEDWGLMVSLVEAGYEGHAKADTLVYHYTYDNTGKQERNERFTRDVLREHFPKVK